MDAAAKACWRGETIGKRILLFGVVLLLVLIGEELSSSSLDESVDTMARLFTEFCRLLRARAVDAFLAVSFFGVVFGGGDMTVVVAVVTADDGDGGIGFFRGLPRVAFFPTSVDFDRLRRFVVFVLEKPSSSLVSLNGDFSATTWRRRRRVDVGFLFKHFSSFSSVSKEKNEINRTNLMNKAN